MSSPGAHREKYQVAVPEEKEMPCKLVCSDSLEGHHGQLRVM